MQVCIRERDTPDGVWVDETELVPISGYSGYFISPSGYVVSYKRKNPVVLRPAAQMNGYLFVVLVDDNKKHHIKRIHRLVAEAFIPNPCGYPYVLHWDDDKTNNDVSNLRWGTRDDNTEDAIRNGKCVTRQVYCYETDTVYESIPCAARQLMLRVSSIRIACSHIKGKVGDYTLCYKENIGKEQMPYNKYGRPLYGKFLKTGKKKKKKNMSEACRLTGASDSHICDVMAGRSKHAHGWTFWKEDHDV